jgi:nucleoside-diphosphate-sugar epimerase
MRFLVTGSAGHLGEALMRTLKGSEHDALGLDIVPSPFTQVVGSITRREVVRSCMRGIDAVLHTATLHKPHVATHSRQAFVDTNITGTLNLLEEAVAAGAKAFVFTSTTSTFGRALVPPSGEPAAWITESVVPVPKNIYGTTKVAAEDLCELIHRDHRLPCIVLRTSRFFPEGDDDERARTRYDADNLKVSEFLYRRVDIEDVVDAHLLALRKAADIGFARYIISATTPFTRDDLTELRTSAAAVVQRRVPAYVDEYARRQWTMVPTIDRVYVNERARAELGWRPKHAFASVIARLRGGGDFLSPLARAVGSKGYHPDRLSNDPTRPHSDRP